MNHVMMHFKKLDPRAKAPTYARAGDAGADLYAIENTTLYPIASTFNTWPGVQSVRTGIALEIPPNHAGLLLPRSGLAARNNVTLANAPGLIDPGYRGEIVCLMVNHSDDAVDIAAGDRIAQIIVVGVVRPFFVESEELSETLRGESGLGSSGR